MGFDLSNLFSYQSKHDTYSFKVPGTDIGDVKDSGEKEYSLSVKELSSFPKGSSITGQIVNVEGEIVQIKLADDIYINARLEKDLNVTAGQKMTFEVKSNLGNTLSLIPLFTNLNTNTNVIKGLEAANIPVNDTTVNMVTVMMDKGMSIDVNALQNMYRQVLSNPKTEPSTLVEMKQLSIPVTSENILQYEACKNYEHQIISGIQDVLNSLEQTCLELVKEGDGQSAANIYKEVVTMLSEAEMLAEQGDILEGIGEENVWKEGNVKGSNNVLAEETIILPADRQTVAEGKIVEAEEALKLEGSKEFWNGKELADANVLKEERELAELLTGRERTALSENLKALGISEQVTESIRDGSISYSRLFSVLSSVLEGDGQKEPVKRLYTSREFQTLIKERFGKQLLIEPRTVGKEGKVSEYYEKLNENSLRLANTLSTLGKENSGLFKSLNALTKNIDFVNQLNHTFAYVQLPLKFSEGTGHGDLYVYTNKKNLAKEDGSISAFLHLDMEHLGPVDVYVSMSGSQKVNTKFYLQDEEMLSFIESNLSILDERLLKRGYSLKAQVVTKSQETKSFAEQLLGNEGQEKHVLLSTQAFDMRA